MVGLVSAELISLLDEHDDNLKLYALQKLNRIVCQFRQISWTPSPTLRSNMRTQEFKDLHWQALVASKIPCSNIDHTATTKTSTVASAQYIAVRVQEQQDPQYAEPMDSRLQAVVEKMFGRYYQYGEYKQRDIPLHQPVGQSRKLKELDYVAINQDQVHLGDHQANAEVRQKLISSDAQADLLMVYQTTQKYLNRVSTGALFVGPTDAADVAQPKLARIKSILSGKETINYTDMSTLKDFMMSFPQQHK
ncbi:hypothetical protein BGX29_006007 [Mortierella sp. GBA35]|nr:hypothetical protein BGX29_006007 [Mortierella sp. GBA35]